MESKFNKKKIVSCLVLSFFVLSACRGDGVLVVGDKSYSVSFEDDSLLRKVKEEYLFDINEFVKFQERYVLNGKNYIDEFRKKIVYENLELDGLLFSGTVTFPYITIFENDMVVVPKMETDSFQEALALREANKHYIERLKEDVDELNENSDWIANDGLYFAGDLIGTDEAISNIVKIYSDRVFKFIDLNRSLFVPEKPEEGELGVFAVAIDLETKEVCSKVIFLHKKRWRLLVFE